MWEMLQTIILVIFGLIVLVVGLLGCAYVWILSIVISGKRKVRHAKRSEGIGKASYLRDRG